MTNIELERFKFIYAIYGLCIALLSRFDTTNNKYLFCQIHRNLTTIDRHIFMTLSSVNSLYIDPAYVKSF